MELLHARLVRKGTCVDGCKCDYTICGDKDPYLRDHPNTGMRRDTAETVKEKEKMIMRIWYKQYD